MNIFPLAVFLRPLAENPWTYLVFGLIGFAFGFVLEMSGFGNSKKLIGQFYFKDLTVLKVMFGAIITAMVLLFLSVPIAVLTVVPGRAKPLQGGVHLVLLAAFLFLSVSP